MDLLGELAAFETAASQAIAAAKDAAALEQVRIEFLGARSGKLKDLQSLLGQVPKADKPAVGKRFNDVKQQVTTALESRQAELARPRRAADAIDVTLPGIAPRLGRRHPLMQTIAEFKEIMGRFGFTSADGPEIEDDWHNFEALNIPKEHPARDPLDNFYLATAARAQGDVDASPRLMRSQTSTVQIRVMENNPPPIRIISVGRVYRPDEIDATHHCMFHQMEGLMIGESVTMAELKTVLRLFAVAYLGKDVTVRFRPSFFPFTEPSVEVDMSWHDPKDPTKTRWIEMGGAGMADPNVLAAVGYTPDEVTGFAFGLGVERVCARRHGVHDIRDFYRNDVRFLHQF